MKPSNPSKGGRTRAEKLSPATRSSIAKQAANARWSVPKVIYGAPDKPLLIGDVSLQCYVLEDETRVLTRTALFSGLNMKDGSYHTGSDRLTRFLEGKIISPFVSAELMETIRNPIKFRLPQGGLNGYGYGYPATLLPDLCDVVFEAWKSGLLQKQQMHIAARCEMLMRSLARVGIIALVDEATGYQDNRDRKALQALLDKYLRKELAAWAKRFPDDFYKQMFRLKNWEWRGMSIGKPGVVGLYTNDLIYQRLAPGLLKELESKNPKNENGHRKSKHHQWLTEDVGHPALAQHVHAVVMFMKASTDWDGFKSMLDRAMPKIGQNLTLNFEGD